MHDPRLLVLDIPQSGRTTQDGRAETHAVLTTVWRFSTWPVISAMQASDPDRTVALSWATILGSRLV
jgi:hypothetical protein